MADDSAPYEFRYVRTMRGGEARTIRKWRSDGWALVDQSRGLFRTEMTFRRLKQKTQRRKLATYGGLILLLLIGVVAALTHGTTLVGGDDDRTPGTDIAAVRDGDGDGISDRAETSGLRTQRAIYVTDPADPDTDGDGLGDGVEAGGLSTNSTWGVVYAGHSDPTEVDSDRDGLDDGSEREGGFDPWGKDSDGDSLDDFVEIEFGSDPLTTNADGDHSDDAEEMRAGSDPNTYDLTTGEAAKAFVGGVAFGDSDLGAHLPLGRLSEEQLNSWQYLAGSIASGFVGVGDARDIVANLGSAQWGEALVSLAGVIPVLGDGVKVTAAAVSFANRGDRASRAAAIYLISKSPALSDATKARVIGTIVRLDPAKSRLSSDAAVRGTSAPAPLPISRPISLSAAQNARKDEIVSDLQARVIPISASTSNR